MKVNRLLLSLIVIASLYSCSEKIAINEVSIEGHLVNVEENEERDVVWSFDDKIYSRDSRFNIYLGELTKTQLKKTEKIFVSGHGHNEFGVLALSQDNDGVLYVLDRPLKGDRLVSLTKIPHTDSIAAIKNQTKWEKFDLSQLPPYFFMGENFAVLSDSTILVTGAPADDLKHVLSIVDYKNQTLTPLNYWPDDDTPDNSIFDKMMVYSHGADVKGNGKGKYLYWNNSGKLSFIFTVDETKVNILSYLYNERLPIPHVDKTPSTERIYGCSNNDRIYLLYKNSNCKGEKIEKYDSKDPFPMGNTVEVYDWDGVKQQVIHLDKFGQRIFLSKNGKTLYLYSAYMSDGSDSYIYSYDLSTVK